ncbi:Hypothetical protein P9515_12491 [Prochlorococcus marinus str. MIT 9515]|uniref:Uncharacterized protein n=1 Tax=Prochlorococcus marinus (strain MIT 9515) TaxID=167542 RepID=A2BXE5_PROM5|nr:hypothetical protein [Prochlorococcus marinus]ABM72456.1 Hypothetical protein P9515_12491 [Prochlorococcus marinus str. MIT 9515]
MFAANQTKKTEIELQKNIKIIDPLTIWLIRIACLLIIIVFSGLLIGLPIAISIGQSLINNTFLNAKEILRNLFETSLA